MLAFLIRLTSCRSQECSSSKIGWLFFQFKVHRQEARFILVALSEARINLASPSVFSDVLCFFFVGKQTWCIQLIKSSRFKIHCACFYVNTTTSFFVFVNTTTSLLWLRRNIQSSNPMCDSVCAQWGLLGARALRQEVSLNFFISFLTGSSSEEEPVKKEIKKLREDRG